MKRMFFFLVGGKKEFEEIFKKYKAKSFIFLNEKYYEKNSETGKLEEVQVQVEELAYDSQLKYWLTETLKIAIEEAATLSSEPIDEGPNDLFSQIDLLIMKMQYDPPKSTFELGAELFTTIAMSHKLINGNKRVGFMFMDYTLFVLGINIATKTTNKEVYKKNVIKLTDFVKRMQSDITEGDEKKRDEVKKEIASWIESLTIIQPIDMHWITVV